MTALSLIYTSFSQPKMLFVNKIGLSYRRMRTRNELCKLSDALLKDIGIERSQINDFVCKKVL